MNLELANWVEVQFRERKKLFLVSNDEKNQQKLLYSLAKLLRQYINSLKTKQGLGFEQKQKAFRMTSWLEGQLLKGDWSANLSYCFDSILYARKYAGNAAAEGRALRNSLTKAEQNTLRTLTRKAHERLERGLGKLDAEESDRVDELRDLGLLSSETEVVQPSDVSGVHHNNNGDS